MHPAIEYFVYKLWRTYPVRWPAACDSGVPDFWICRDLCLCVFESNTNEAYYNTNDCSGTPTSAWFLSTLVRYHYEA